MTKYVYTILRLSQKLIQCILVFQLFLKSLCEAPERENAYSVRLICHCDISSLSNPAFSKICPSSSGKIAGTCHVLPG